MSFWKKTMEALGFEIDEHRYGYDEETGPVEYSEAVVEPRSTNERRHEEASRVHSHSTSDKQEEHAESTRLNLKQIVTLRPKEFKDARTVGEQFRKGLPVIMNLDSMEGPDHKRVVDFAAGLVFALRGKLERVSANVILLSPHNVLVTAEDKQLLERQQAEAEFYNQK